MRIWCPRGHEYTSVGGKNSCLHVTNGVTRAQIVAASRNAKGRYAAGRRDYLDKECFKAAETGLLRLG